MKKNLVSVLAAGLLIFLGLTATGMGEQKELTFPTWVAGFEREMMVESFKEFERENPDIKVKLMFVAGNYAEKLLTMVASGETPDVLPPGPLFQQLVSNNILAELDPHIARDTTFERDDFWPMLWGMGTYKGKQYTLPFGYVSRGMFYSKKLFDQAGMSYPDKTWDWDRFLEAAQGLTRDITGDGRTDEFGAVFATHTGSTISMIWNWGGYMFNEDMTESIINGDKAVAALQFLGDLVNKYHVTPPYSRETSDVWGWDDQMFMTGTVAMELGDTLSLPGFRNIEGWEWDITTWPKGESWANIIWSGQYGLSTQTKYPEEAWKVVKWVTDEMEVPFSKVGNSISTRKSQSHIFVESNKPSAQVFVDMTEYGRYGLTDKLVNGAKISSKFGTAGSSVIFGLKTARDALDELKKTIDSLLTLEDKTVRPW